MRKKVGCYTVLMSVLYILRRFLLKQSQYGAWCVWLFDEKIPRKTKEMSFWSWEKKARLLGCLQSRLYYSYYCHLGYLVSKLRRKNICTPGPLTMQIHLVQYSTSARYEKYSNIHLVRPIIHLVRIFALSTSWIN